MERVKCIFGIVLMVGSVVFFGLAVKALAEDVAQRIHQNFTLVVIP